MDPIIQFISEQSILISAIIVVVALIIQEILADKKGAESELTAEESAVMCFKGAKLIDIRDKEDYRTLHADTAIWSNPTQLEMHPEKNLKSDKTYIFYCSDGVKSGELANLLRRKSGYKTFFIAQGFPAWTAADLKTKSGGS
tara:strand:- start:6576 stop:7001 length:426 start_codon:yes stop_codon:yes gene_type:complete